MNIDWGLHFDFLGETPHFAQRRHAESRKDSERKLFLNPELFLLAFPCTWSSWYQLTALPSGLSWRGGGLGSLCWGAWWWLWSWLWSIWGGETEVETRGKFCRIIEIANLQAKVWEVRRGGRLSLSRSWPSSNYLESVCQKKTRHDIHQTNYCWPNLIILKNNILTGGLAGGLFLGLGGLACPKVGGRGLMPGGGVPVGGRRSFKGLPNITCKHSH